MQVDPEGSKWKVTARNVDFVIPRKEAGEYWERLNKGTKLHTVKVSALPQRRASPPRAPRLSEAARI